MYIYKKKINFYDCDPAGIMFYGRVYELCHAAYEAMIESCNLNYDYWTNDKFIVPIIKSEASYHKPMKYGEEISVEIEVAQLKSSSFELVYECKNTKGEKCVKIRTVHVFVDKNNWEKTDIVYEVREGLEKHLT